MINPVNEAVKPQFDKKRKYLIRYINLKLASLGLPNYKKYGQEFLELSDGLLRNYREKTRLLQDKLPPVDQRIHNFLESYLKEFRDPGTSFLPEETFVLDKKGLARELSLPVEGNYFANSIVQSYRVTQGVLHNPVNDRRTTKGVFHVVEDGLPVPLDKKQVPRRVFANMLKIARKPPEDLLQLPFLSEEKNPAGTFVSLLVKPLVAPAISGFSEEKRMEVRFFAPGSLVSNLDFIESIFGNGGDPFLPENNFALDFETWTGNSGAVILAPHLLGLSKKDLGLPNKKDATERQIKEGMCWEKEDDVYNEGLPFKITARNEEGITVTLIADNYFGYCKKEVKTQISFASNLFGGVEEEHAGGAIAFPRYSLGDTFTIDAKIASNHQTFEEVKKEYGDLFDLQPEGYGIDKVYNNIYYVPEDVEIDLRKQTVSWGFAKKEVTSIPLSPDVTYVHPCGYKIDMEKHPGAPSWRLVGTTAKGTFCHKPCTVSGGGKSEISKSLSDAIHYGPFFVADLESDLDRVEEIVNKNYSDRFREKISKDTPSRPLLSPKRSLGSVIRLLNASDSEFTDEYNKWLHSIPTYIIALVLIIKRFYREEWGENWREHFSADIINGEPGHELKLDGRALVACYLRVGLENEGNWRTFKLRQDFVPAAKVQMEDDITASIVVPKEQLKSLNLPYKNPSLKISQNCEARLFQRPDEAIHRGYDKQTEWDLAQEENFVSNFEPMPVSKARELLQNAIEFHEYTEPMQDLIKRSAQQPDGSYFTTSAHPRIVDGKPTKNPRYLQIRPDLVDPRGRYLAEISTKLSRRVPCKDKILFPVNAVLPGRRNNPPQPKEGIRALAVYNPIHYQELPELFMDFICSLTGKSPSTTGAGSEGALTKGPFNSIHPTADLNASLISYILTGYQGFTTAAGYVGPKYRMDHDISLLIPELWSRLSESEQDPRFLINEGCLEKLNDFDHNGEKILASRLGYRITKTFLIQFFGRVFDSPASVFNEEILKPELQDYDSYIDGIKNITEAQERVAKTYFDDGSVEGACPPLKVLLHVMAHGHYEGKGIHEPELREMFTREYLLQSEWYHECLSRKQKKDIRHMERGVKELKSFLENPMHHRKAQEIGVADRLQRAEERLKYYKSDAYLKSLQGTIGAPNLFGGSQ